MPISPQLLQAIAAPEGGRVVLVVGAGCSFEPPTRIPLAKPCSQEAHRRLVEDGVLAAGECTCSDDLSALADFVKAKLGTQKPLVDRLPITEFRNATPNEGHLVAAALLLEGAVTHVLTLNFDLALSHALSVLGAKHAVSVIKGPEDHAALGRANIIYLHRNVELDGESWVLTSESLESAWKDAWEQLIANMVTTTPITVFAGMGSSCGVLRQSIERLRTALDGHVSVFLADPGDPDWSNFATEMNLNGNDYIQTGWVDFMRALSTRLAEEHSNHIAAACSVMTTREGWTQEDLSSLRSKLKSLGLVGLGKLRASWLLDDRPYCCHEGTIEELLADILLALALIERTAGVSIQLHSDRIVEITTGSNQRLSFLVFSGKGSLRWTSAETEILYREKYCPLESASSRPRRALVSGVTGPSPARVSPPPSIVDQEDEKSIMADAPTFKMWSTDDLRTNTTAVLQELIS